MKGRKLKALTSLLIVVLSIVMISSCASHQKNGENAYVKLVKTAKVLEVSPIQQKQFPGTIEEAEKIGLAFRVAGPIQKLYVKEGDYVKKGQLIVEMDTRDYEIQKNAIESQVIQLQAEYKRVEELNKRKSVADNDYEKMKAGKRMAEVKLKNAEDQLRDTRLYAPFAGYITRVMYEEGEMVNHGTPVASLVDVSMLKVEIHVPASLYIQRSSITGITCTQEDIPGKTFPLTLYADNIKANNNGLYKLYLYHKPSPGTKLAPGMNISVNVSYASEESTQLSILASAVYEKDGRSYVWVVDNDVVRSREVATNSLLSSGSIGITHGLKAGEQVVTGGINLLTENETVQIVAQKSRTNIGGVL